MIFSVFQKNRVFGYSWSTLLWYQCYYPHRSRDALSPVCGIFIVFFFTKLKKYYLNLSLPIGNTNKQKSQNTWLIGIYFRARPKKRSLEEEQINVPGLEEVIKTTVLIVFYSVPEPLCFSVPVFVVPDQNPISDQTTWPPDQNPCAFTDQIRSTELFLIRFHKLYCSWSEPMYW